MAIVNSHTVSGAKGSLGSTYYAQRYGRTIQAQKPSKRASATTRGDVMGIARESFFGLVSLYMASHAEDIKASFNRVAYGSARNYFFKINKAALREALEPILLGTPGIAEIEKAITTYVRANPTRIYRVKKTGFPHLFLTDEWNSEDNPSSIIGPSAHITQIGATPIVGKIAEIQTTTNGDELAIVGTNLGALACTGSDLVSIAGNNLVINKGFEGTQTVNIFSDKQPILSLKISIIDILA